MFHRVRQRLVTGCFAPLPRINQPTTYDLHVLTLMALTLTLDSPISRLRSKWAGAGGGCFIFIMHKTRRVRHSLFSPSRLVDSKPHSRMWYRIGAVRSMTGGRKTQPSTRMSDRLKEVSYVRNTIHTWPHLLRKVFIFATCLTSVTHNHFARVQYVSC